MPDILPQKPKPILRINPKVLLIYGRPKTGKTEELSTLPDSLTLATEDGIEMYNANWLRITSISGGTTYYKKEDDAVKANPELEGQIKTTSLDTFITMMNTEAARQVAAKEQLKFPYKWIAVDTIDEFESQCDTSATAKYKQTSIGKGMFEKGHFGKSVTEIPNGYGYQYIRNEMIEKIDQLARYCKYLILVAHVRDKVLDKGGIAVEQTDISLTGKLAGIVAAKCDAIGYCYREPGKPKMISFESYDNTGVMGARFPRLAGKKMEFKWSSIYLEEGL